MTDDLERRLAQSQTLAEFTQRALKGMDLDRMLEELCLATVDVLETDYCDVFELLPDEEKLVLRAGVGWPDEYYNEKTLDTSPGSQSGYTVRTWEPTVVEDIRQDERFRRPAMFAEADVLGGVTVVVPGPDKPWGVFGVHSREPRSFDQYDVTFVQSMGQVLSQAVHRARAEQRIREEKARFESLVSKVEEYAVFRIDEEGYVQTWNIGAERMKGYSEEEILGEHFSILYTEEDQEAGRAMRNLERAREQGGTEDEGWRRRKDGSRFWANVTITPYHDEQGRIQGFWKVVRDLTERRRYEEALEASNERLERFAYAASHDLKEPLRRVTSYMELIERRYIDELDDQGREFLEEAVDGARRMDQLIDSLLKYARVTTDGYEVQAIDTGAVFEDALADLELQIAEAEAEITVAELPTVEADPDLLGQVFRNLLSNAMRYSGDARPRIFVDAERDGEVWRFSIRDEGIGIAPEHTEDVFDVFESFDSDESQGTGIGLAICQEIVDRHGGEIWVESEQGEGSTFHFTVPAAQADPQVAPA